MASISLPEDLNEVVARALSEDLGAGDLTAGLLPADLEAEARVVVREPAVLCGAPWFDEVFAQLDPDITVCWHHDEGDELETDATVCSVAGRARSLLTGERTALNFLQTLSGTATTARRHAAAIAGTGTSILDTRKTLPGLRTAQKYAVRCGGGNNHRMGLYDAVLVKDNHLAQWGEQWIPKLEALVAEAVIRPSVQFVEVEVDDLDQFKAVLGISGIDIILLDNMDEEQMKTAVSLRDEVRGSGPAPLLEASGAITLENITSAAGTGVDRIAVGALTHSALAVDIGMDRAGP